MRSSRSGAASLELALLAPVALLMFFALIDISDALLTARRMQIAANAIAQAASTDSSQTATLNELTDVQALDATTAAYALFPQWGRSAKQDSGFTVTLSGISSTASPNGCTSSCSYSPYVVWSVYAILGRKKWRKCGPTTVFSNGNNPDYAHVWQGDVGATSFFVADVRWTFIPPFFSPIVGNISMLNSAVVSPRIGNGTTLISTGQYPTVELCQSSQSS